MNLLRGGCMKKKMTDAESPQRQWAQFRFSIIGHLLSAPPDSGELKKAFETLSQKQWAHPITQSPVNFGVSTIERWFYSAKKSADPVNVLRSKRRSDANKTRQISEKLKCVIQQQHRDHPGWSYQLHRDNLAVRVKQSSDLGNMPSYSTIRRYMKANGFLKRRVVRQRDTAGAQLAEERLEQREVRSFEMDHVHALWHLDFHHGSRKILDKDGQWQKPLLLCILDDRSRVVCHAQWYFDETTESLVHGFVQALQKRGLPRALMSDNGSAMMAGEFTEGLERLSILHKPTLPYSPYQNAKQEVLWAQVEGRLMAMLEGEPELTLPMLNEATLAWVEFEYHRKFHTEIATTPLDRYLKDPNVGRTCPNSVALRQAFCIQVKRKQRRSDATFTLEAKRFEVPSQYRHLEYLCVRYARWDLSYVTLVDPNTDQCLELLYPQDKSANAEGMRRALSSENKVDTHREKTSSGIAPLLKELMAEYAATGLPPAYIPKEEKP